MLETLTVGAKTFWSLLQREDMGGSFTGPDEVEAFAAAHLGEIMSPLSAEAVFAALMHWRNYDGHRAKEFLLYLVDILNQTD
jgi:hypothetical protein